jgi:hypothetical protein
MIYCQGPTIMVFLASCDAVMITSAEIILAGAFIAAAQIPYVF